VTSRDPAENQGLDLSSPCSRSVRKQDSKRADPQATCCSSSSSHSVSNHWDSSLAWGLPDERLSQRGNSLRFASSHWGNCLASEVHSGHWSQGCSSCHFGCTRWDNCLAWVEVGLVVKQQPKLRALRRQRGTKLSWGSPAGQKATTFQSNVNQIAFETPLEFHNSHINIEKQ